MTTSRLSTKRMSNFAHDILNESPDVNMPTNECQLEAYSTNKLNDIASDIFKEMEVSVVDNKQKLIPLKSWLDKKQQSPPYSWQKRWVVISMDGYLMWSERQITIQDGVDEIEKRRWNKCVPLLDCGSVLAVDTKKQRSFMVHVKSLKRDFI